MPENIVPTIVGETLLNRVVGQPDNTSPAFTRNQRLTLLAVCVVAYLLSAVVFSYLPLFRTPGFGGSLLVDGNPIISLTKVIVWTSIVFFVASIAGRGVRPDAGLFAAAIALFAARRTGGLTRNTYLAHPTSQTLTMFAVELVLLGLFVGVLHVVTRHLVARGTLLDDARLDGMQPKREPTGQKVLALLTHALVAAVLILITVKSDQRNQVTGMIVVASLLASICTVRFIPATPSFYFWIGPMAAGLVGYVVTGISGTNNLIIGEPSGYCAALARALPLDYASAGVAGSLYGYWIGRTLIPEDALEKPAASPARPAATSRTLPNRAEPL